MAKDELDVGVLPLLPLHHERDRSPRRLMSVVHQRLSADLAEHVGGGVRGVDEHDSSQTES